MTGCILKIEYKRHQENNFLQTQVRMGEHMSKCLLGALNQTDDK